MVLKKEISKLLAITLSLVIVFCLLPVTVNAEDATEYVIPDSQQLINSSTKLKTGISSETTIIEMTDSVAHFDDETGYFYVAKPTPGATAWEANDLGKITFKNAGKIGDRSIDAIVNIKSVSFGDSHKAGGPTNTEFEFARFRYNDKTDEYDLWFYGYENGWYGSMTVDVVTNVVWSDTQQTVNLPFIHAIRDLDTYSENSETRESFQTASGYQHKYYKYSTAEWDYKEQTDGNMKFLCKTPPDPNGYTGEVDERTKGGVYLATENGQFESLFIIGDCGSGYELYSQYMQPNGTTNPFKAVNSGADKSYSVGDTVTFDVSYTMGTLFDNTFTPYTGLKLYDDIPEGLTYKTDSARLVDDDGNDISDIGNITYDYNTDTVAIDINSDWLNNIEENYKGKNLILRFDAIVNQDAPSIIKNTGHAVVDNADMPTNEVEIKVKSGTPSGGSGNGGNGGGGDDFYDDVKQDEHPAVPETGVNPNLFIMLSLTALAATAVIIKKHKA